MGSLQLVDVEEDGRGGVVELLRDLLAHVGQPEERARERDVADDGNAEAPRLAPEGGGGLPEPLREHHRRLVARRGVLQRHRDMGGVHDEAGGAAERRSALFLGTAFGLLALATEPVTIVATAV